MSTSLFVVPTPIGNLADMTYRAIEVLKSVDLILAEDTRTSGKLLKHFDIQNKITSFHIHNEHKILDKLVERMKEGEVFALISDAGTPAISDPGYLLVRACLDASLKVECLPGATAFVPALVNSGFPLHNFIFEGFLPHKKGRKTKLEELTIEKRTIVVYESPHRIKKLVEEIEKYMGRDRRICISRELSKLHEENLYGTVAEIKEILANRTLKGEIVVVIEGNR